MYVTVCHKRLPVRIVNDLRGDDGGFAWGLWEPGQMRIALDRACPPDERRETLIHEIGHAWDDIAGRVDPDDEEARQRRLAAIDAQFSKDLAEQGGEICIHRLFGDEDTIPQDEPFAGDLSTEIDESAADWPVSVACPACHQRHSSGAVRNGEPMFHPKINGFARWRQLTCINPSCQRTSRWLQQCNFEGMPLPNVIVAPSYRTVAKVAD